jgi:putative protease
MKKSRSASKKRSAKKKPAKSRSAAARRKVPKKVKKTAKARSAGAKRRTSTKTRARAAAKKTRPRKATKKAGARKPAPARKRTTAAAKKKPTARVAPPKPAPTPLAVPANELKVGVVTHYYSHLSVAVVAVTDRRLQVGDRIHIKGHTSDFYQTVNSLQIEHDQVSATDIGQAVGLKVTEHAREHDVVYLVT